MSKKCSLCKNPIEGGVCAVCGLFQPDDFIAYRTVCIPDEKAGKNYNACTRRMLTAWSIPKYRRTGEKAPDEAGNGGEYRYAYKKATDADANGGEYRYAYKKASDADANGGEYRYAYKKASDSDSGDGEYRYAYKKASDSNK